MTKIVAFSGRKQAGKDTCGQFLASVLPLTNVYSFAKPLKEMAINLLGCPRGLVYGTDKEKDTKVEHLLWENFPVPVFNLLDGGVQVGGLVDKQFEDSGIWVEWVYDTPEGALPKSGAMSVREILQYWGTEVFRKQYYNIWADACIRSIRTDAPMFAIITDCRFPNEVDTVKEAGGKVVRLTRKVSKDAHVSETMLDPDKYDWSNFDYVVDNQDNPIVWQCRDVFDKFQEWGWISQARRFEAAFRSFAVEYLEAT